MAAFNPPRGRHDQVGQIAKAPFAHWADPARVTTSKTWRSQGRAGEICLGYVDGEGIAPLDNRHLITIAGSRAGKTQTLLLPNLRTYDGPILAIDPKGELASNSAKLRAERVDQDIHVLDPFREASAECAPYLASYNPLIELAALDREDIPDEVASLCEALIIEDKGGDSHWTTSARNLLRGLILNEIDLEDAPNLVRVRDRLTSGEYLKEWLIDMCVSDAFDGIVKRVALSQLSKDPKEASSIVSTATEQTAFLDSPKLRKTLEQSSFSLRTLKAKPATIYLVLPAARMGSHSRWLRMFITLAFSFLEREKAKPIAPVLIVLEEFAALGYLRPIETAAGFIAGADVKLWTVLQDLSQLQAHYKTSWETFIGNCGILTAFGNADATTLEYLSRRLGETSYQMVEQVPTSHSGMAHGDMGERIKSQTSRLATASELGILLGRNTNRCLVHMAEAHPFVVDRLPYGAFGDEGGYTPPNTEAQ